MGTYGVRVLDVGTGPGPSAFAIHDFYSAMVAFSEITGNSKWHQPAHLNCVEIDGGTNYVRHNLAEIMFEQSQRESEGVLAMCHNLGDFKEIAPTTARKRGFERLLNQEDHYFDAVEGEWISEPSYSPDEANYIAQSLHRYRLIVFSNFLTTIGTVRSFESTLVDVLKDVNSGSGVLVLGGKSGEYPKIYDFVDGLAKRSGFKKVMDGEPVSYSDSEVATRIFSEACRFYDYLTTLVSEEVVEEEVATQLNEKEQSALRKVRKEFEVSYGPAPISQIRAYRKYGTSTSRRGY
ncbi:MAG: hypothetical protein OXH63_09125 [Gemmatimonadetes bacterium]|nr:hypothetical protein [Gemmatimonadota bacterium]